MFYLEQPVESLMRTTMENIKNMIDVNTVIGDAVETKDGNIIVPVSRVSFAFVAGGGEYTGAPNKEENDPGKLPFAGGSGAGITVQPIGFLAATNGQLKVIPIRYSNAVDRIIDMVPDIVNNIESYLVKNKDLNEKEFNI